MSVLGVRESQWIIRGRLIRYWQGNLNANWKRFINVVIGKAEYPGILRTLTPLGAALDSNRKDCYKPWDHSFKTSSLG